MVDTIKGETCPICLEKRLSLTEDEMEIPFLGKTFVFSMHCEGCGFHKADIEAAEMKDSCKLTFTIVKEEDMKVRVVKSSEATIRVPQLHMTVTPGPASEGYISNIEGLLNRFEKVIEDERESSEEENAKTTAKNLLKKIRKVKSRKENKEKIILPVNCFKNHFYIFYTASLHNFLINFH